MVDQAWYQQDHSDDEPLLEKFARDYHEAHPEYDMPAARAIIDTHPAMQVLLGRLPDEPPAPAPVTTLERPKVGAYEWMGEVKDLDPQRGWMLLAEYRSAAAALHAAKERAKAIEQEIMQELEGFEHGAINGQQVFHWPYVDSTSFDTKSFKEDPTRKALYESYLVTKPTRRFKVDGTVGVD